MKRENEAGFTILETMLFLAITALMIVTVIVGSNSSINHQRYFDSVNTLKSILQQQYSDTENTIHEIKGTLGCESATGALTTSVSTITSGQTDCVILGKFITMPDAKQLYIYDVVGTIPAASTYGLDDTTIFIKDNTTLSLPPGYGTYISDTKLTYPIDWGASLSNGTGAGIKFSMAILRSPLTGNIVTFYNQTLDTTSPAGIGAIVSSANIVAAKFCVKSEGIKGMAVAIAAGATNASGVSTLGEATSGCP